ncbi:MAG: TatD family hydrolase [Candidatus Saccharimonadales bacterium]
MQFVDTHCHIHEALDSVDFGSETRARYQKAGMPKPDDIIARAIKDGVTRMICVGTTLEDSQLAVEFVQARPSCWASIGIHPHEAKDHLGTAAKKQFAALATQAKVVAVGECGLDYFYENSPKAEQIDLLHFQLHLAEKHNLPVIFHVRDAFDDFWPVFDTYKVRGVIHSFSATRKELDEILARNLFVGLNGIITFTKNAEQLAAAKAVPLGKMLLETDSPFLTPHPYRGTICEPKHIRATAEFLAELRREPLAEIAQKTTTNAHKLFGV